MTASTHPSVKGPFLHEVAGYRAGRSGFPGLVLARAYYPVLEAIATNKLGILLNQSQFESISLANLDESLTLIAEGFAAYLGRELSGQRQRRLEAIIFNAGSSGGAGGKDKVVRSLLRELERAGTKPMPIRLECRYSNLDGALPRLVHVNVARMIRVGVGIRCVPAADLSDLAGHHIRTLAGLAGSHVGGARKVNEQWNRARTLFRSGFNGILSNMLLSYQPQKANFVSMSINLPRSIAELNMLTLRFMDAGAVDLHRKEARLVGSSGGKIHVVDLYEIFRLFKPIEDDMLAFALAS